EEEFAVEKQLGIQIPSREEVWKNQALNRMYQDDEVSYMTAALITKGEAVHPQTSAVTFILAPHYLLTMRYIAPTSFQMFAHRLQRMPQKFTTGVQVLEGLLEEVIMRVAHNSEVVVDGLDQLSHNIFGENLVGVEVKNTSQKMLVVLKRLGTFADLNSKINESLHSINRLLSFFKQVNNNDAVTERNIKTLLTDVFALTQQTAFLSDKITFQLDATLGMINVEQNTIMKVFSVASLFFLPPTLVGSLYGMNFEYMPELHWMYGYPMAVGLMAFCSLIPYMYFRRKGWL
ncbi:MAG: magnesium transporter CorA family protein, partial [Rickettsiales bacterium]|nr:magnesium transporter CorA family protein [Rickettsiales bacterium]